MPITTQKVIEPTTGDLDAIVKGLEDSWTARLTVRRQSPRDIGYREIYVALDDESIAILRMGEEITLDVTPGPHLLKVHNTLFRKALHFTVNVGDHASFIAVNRAGFGTYSVLAFFMGGGPIYLTFEREGPSGDNHS